MKRLLYSPSFWVPFVVTLVITDLFFLWELGYIRFLPFLPRPAAYLWEILFTGTLGSLLSLNTGLIVWQSKYGKCPIGVKRASGAAGVIGALTLICPACVLLPASLIGIGFFFVAITPYLPLLRVMAVVLLFVSSVLLWPKK